MIAFDTNVLVYAVDTAAGEKHVLAKGLLGRTYAEGQLLLPLQVAVEFFNVLVRRLRRPPEEAVRFIDDWLSVGTVVAYDRADLAQAITAHRAHDIPIWDALIWAVCERVGVEVLVSEDFQNGRRLGRVTFLNPFDPANAARLGLA